MPPYEVDWQQLKSWIARQEASEAANSAPAPLTAAQMTGIRLILANESEPDVGSNDWVSLLGRYCQSYGAKDVIIRFHEYRAPSMRGSAPRWIVRCMMGARDARDGHTFPLADGPADDPDLADSLGPSTPSFGCKRVAKQYAAKCCVEWLQKEGFMPDDGINASFNKGPRKARKPPAPKPPSVPPPPSSVPPPPSSPPASERARAMDLPPSRRLSSRSSSASPFPPAAATTTSASTSTAAATAAAAAAALAAAPAHLFQTATASPMEPRKEKSVRPQVLDVAWVCDDRVPITQRVSTLCEHLGLMLPAYRMTSGGPRGDLWTGAPDFGVDDMLVPQGLGRIMDVRGKKQAKNMMAEELLPFLLKLYADRQVKVKELIMSMDEDVSMDDADAERREPVREL